MDGSVKQSAKQKYRKCIKAAIYYQANNGILRQYEITQSVLRTIYKTVHKNM